MAVDLHGKVALVTGSTSGIGATVAHTLAKRGCDIVVTGLGEEGHTIAEDITRQHGVKSVYIEADLLVMPQLEALVIRVLELYPDGVDILINNAGFYHFVPIDEYPDDQWDAMLGVHLSSAFHLIKRLVPGMKKKGWGRIVNMSSQMGVVSAPGYAVYSAVKSALIGLAKGVALDMAGYGITCNAICPTYVRTKMFDVEMEEKAKQNGTTFQEAMEDKVAMVPTKMPATPGQIADMILFLVASEASSQLTGAHYLIDGGFTAQ